jgi:hypothetical protein
MTRQGICDGCGQLAPVIRGVCAMCRVDGVPTRLTAAERRDESRGARIAKGRDSFPTIAREQARVAAIRAEDVAGWAAVIGPPRAPGDHVVAQIHILARDIGTEQAERALWWAGPNIHRLEQARSFLAAGRRLGEDGTWGPIPLAYRMPQRAMVRA